MGCVLLYLQSEGSLRTQRGSCTQCGKKMVVLPILARRTGTGTGKVEGAGKRGAGMGVRVDERCRYQCPSWPTGTKAASSSEHRVFIEICESRKATGVGIIGEMGSSVVNRRRRLFVIFGLLEARFIGLSCKRRWFGRRF